MKKIILSTVVSVVLAGCTVSQQTVQQKAEQQIQTAQQVSELLQSRRYAVDIKYMYPQRGMMKALDYGYGVRISGDSIYSYLPYFGVARGYVPYGGGTGLHFKTVFSDYSVRKSKKYLTQVVVVVSNEEDRYRYTMDIYDNGNVQLSVQADRRDFISFSGEMVLDDRKNTKE